MKQKKPHTLKWILIIIVLIILAIIIFLIASVVSLLFTYGGTSVSVGTGNVMLIPVKGVIMPEAQPFLFGQEVASSSEIVKQIETANENQDIVAILIEINSPGGTPVASEEIAAAIKNSEKYTVAWIREQGTSGAYWAASSADRIIANRMSVIGSIGVIASYLEFTGLMKKYGVGYERFVGGEYKDIATPFRNPTKEEQLLFQDKINRLHKFFVDSVAENRGLTQEQKDRISTAEFFLGSEGKEIGLIDVLGGKKEAIALIETELNVSATVVEIRKKKTFLNILSEMLGRQSFFFGQGFADMLLEKDKAQGLELRT